MKSTHAVSVSRMFSPKQTNLNTSDNIVLSRNLSQGLFLPLNLLLRKEQRYQGGWNSELLMANTVDV